MTEFDIADLNFRNLDNDQPGFSVGAISNNLSENENLASFSVVLDVKPNDNVFFDITSNDGSEVAVEAGFEQLQFTPLNWNIPQIVLVSGVDDTIVDGDQFTEIIISVDGNSDSNFLSESPQNVTVINADNDFAQIIMSVIDQLTGEDGSLGSLSISLSSMPTAPVQISLSSNNINEGVLVSSTIIISPSDWNQPQIISVAGVDDHIPIRDGAINYNILSLIHI